MFPCAQRGHYQQTRNIEPRGAIVSYLWGIRVVKHAEDDPGHGVLGVGHVPRRGKGGQVVL